MDTQELILKFKELLALIAGNTFGTWQFWTAWGVGLVLVLIFGKVFAKAIAKSEKPFIGIFLGNVIVAILMLAAAWAVICFGSPHLEDPFVGHLLSSLAAAICGILFSLLLGPVFWAESRAASSFSCFFALALGYAALFATDKSLEILDKGSESIEERQKKIEASSE